MVDESQSKRAGVLARLILQDDTAPEASVCAGQEDPA
jgi:hypothetical protein